MLGAIGAPGIPSVGMLSMVLVLESVGLPTAAIAILLPIDRILDTVRTAVNVEGDMVGSLIVQKLADRPGGMESATDTIATTAGTSTITGRTGGITKKA
jgi:Na+/H+-dicarboxylate symporter